VKEIVEKIDAATQRSDETAQSISRIAEQSGESAKAMEEIFQALNEVNQGTMQITEALEHLVGSSTQVRDASVSVIQKSDGAREALERVSSLSHQNDQGINEISGAIGEVNLAIQQIRELGTRIWKASESSGKKSGVSPSKRSARINSRQKRKHKKTDSRVRCGNRPNVYAQTRATRGWDRPESHQVFFRTSGYPRLPRIR
jgi:methyl-accepting chemotaxis protein